MQEDRGRAVDPRLVEPLGPVHQHGHERGADGELEDRDGVDVAALISNIPGIEVSDNAETAGTVGLAYAIHKAASPIRFPPTVALTPIFAKNVFGKDEAAAEGE